VAFSEQQTAKIYEDADEVQHMPPVSDEKPVYDSDPHNLGTEEKSDSQHVNLLISGNSQPLITKYHNTMDELSNKLLYLTPGIIFNDVSPENDIQGSTMLEPQEKPEKAQSLFPSVLKKLGILKQEPPVEPGYIRLRWQCVSCLSPPKV
jgi:hypothetical protein